MSIAAVGHAIFLTATWLLALGWVRVFLAWMLHAKEVPDITRIPHEGLPPLKEMTGHKPHLTVIVPARNEESNIAATIRSLLASRGIRLQVIAVDDRSSDATGRILDEIAQDTGAIGEEHSYEAMHIARLPDNWLGKPHALALAARKAEGDWILFTDGDVKFAPDAAAVGLCYALSEQADHFVLMPDWTLGSAGEAAMHGAIHAITAWGFRPWRIPDPKARDFLGVGAFNMIRKEVYESIEGFEGLQMEILEDLRLGWAVKRARYRQRLAIGPGLASVRWSHGAMGVIRNLEKNLFALYRFRTWLAVAAGAGLAVQIFLPLAALAMGGWLRVAAAVTYAGIAGVYLVSTRLTRVPAIYVLGFPVGAALFLFALIRSVSLALIRGGVVWRETLYPLEELRAKAGPFW